MFKRILLGALVASCLVSQAVAQSAVLPYFYNASNQKTPVGTNSPFPITGSISASLAPFTPGLSGARGTPVTVTTSDSSGTLPTNTGSVIVYNVGANPMYCNVNAIAATTSDQYISASGGWFNFGIPSGITTLRCIATGGSTTANTAGGSGLGAGTGGGSGGGGGGAVTIADGADVTQGALADAASSAGGTGSQSAKLRLMTTQLGTLNTSLGTINTTLGTPLQAGGTVVLTAETTKVIGTVRVASGGIAAGALAAGAGVDGWDLTQGAIADAAVTAGATGSVSAKLRSISRDVMTTNTWAAGTLGAMANYGTSPGAVLVPGVNAFVTNTLAAGNTNADAVAASTSNASPVQGYGFVFNGTTWDRMRSGTQTGSVAVASADPCLGANKTNLAINQNGTASVQLIALSGSTVIYVCSLSLIAAAATTVAITTGTGSACVTGNAAVIGTTTASIANSISLAANGGLTLGNGAGTVAKGAAAGELCMILGSNIFVSGNLTYVQQ